MEVLLVDDQALTIQVYAASVRKTFGGARVHMAVDLPEALQIAAGRALDLVLLDLSLPTCSGIDALHRFRKAFPAVPVLVVSANEDQERIQACLEAGARGYITKTLAITGLPVAMKMVLDGGRYVPSHWGTSRKPVSSGAEKPRAEPGCKHRLLKDTADEAVMETVCKDRTSTVTMKREGSKSMLMTISSTGQRGPQTMKMRAQAAKMDPAKQCARVKSDREACEQRVRDIAKQLSGMVRIERAQLVARHLQVLAAVAAQAARDAEGELDGRIANRAQGFLYRP